MTPSSKVEEVVPAAGRTINSLRDIGYELPQAVADLVDNSIEADATKVCVDLVFEGSESWVRIADNGRGMDSDTITESLRIGSVRDYDEDDLGKFGFGLKTASLSQCRRLTLASRESGTDPLQVRVFDLDHIERTNRWEVLVVDDQPIRLVEPLKDAPGTVVVWEKLDRLLTYKDPAGHWAKRKLLEQTELVAQHLSMVFHRFLGGTALNRQQVEILVNGSTVEPWDPFCADEPGTTALEPTYHPVVSDGRQGIVSLHPYVLPGQAEFSDASAWNRASGPNKWNNQQGLYIYRADRLIQWGGWNHLRTNDEHTKLARVSLEFSSDLDTAFGINISKAIVKLPPELREEIRPVIRTVTSAAQNRYRSNPAKPPRLTPTRPASSGSTAATQTVTPTAAEGGGTPSGAPLASPPPFRRDTTSTPAATPTGVPAQPGVVSGPREALEQAARAAGEVDALHRIIEYMRTLDPEATRALGW